MKRENDIWRKWWLGLANFKLVVPWYRNHLIDLLHKSKDWFLYNDNRSSLNGKVDAWLK